jgi:hypothetical protein
MCALFIWVDWNGWQSLHTYHTTLRTLAQFISKNKFKIILFSHKKILEGNLRILYHIQKYSISWIKSKNLTNYSANICWSYPLHYDIPIGQSPWHQSVKEKGFEWTSPHDYTSPVLDGGQFIHRLWIGQPPVIVSFWAGLRKKDPFFLPFFSNPFYKPTKPLSKAYNPFSSSLSCIFGGLSTLVSNISMNNAHNFIYSTIVHSNVSFIQ